MAQTQVTWCRHAIEDHWSEEFWLIVEQYPSAWDQHHDIVTYTMPESQAIWLALRYPLEWSWADVG